MVDVLLLVTQLLVCGGLGLPFAHLLSARRFAWRALLAPTFGAAVLAIALPVGYRLGATVPQIFVASAVLAAVGLGVYAHRGAACWTAAAAASRRVGLLVGGAWVAATLVLVAPRFVGGDQFAVFQGNQWDTYGYLESAAVYARKPYRIVSTSTDAVALSHPLYPIPQQQLGERPSIHLMYAAFSRVAPSHFHQLHYTFLVGFFVQFVLVAMFAMRNLLPRAPPLVWIGLSLVFPLGFWGQYVFDINAWSQISSTALLFAIFALILDFTMRKESPDSPRSQPWRDAAGVGVLVGGAVYLYPEGFIIYAAALAPIAITVPIVRAIRARDASIRPVIPMFGMGALASAALYPPILRHLIKQVTWSSGAVMPWWQYFQAFFRGRDNLNGAGFDRAVDFAAALFGLYFATPAEGGALATTLRLAIVVLLVGSLAGVVATAVTHALDDAGADRLLVLAWIVAAIFLLLPAAHLFNKANYWPAGKVVSFAAPAFMTVLALPAAARFSLRALRPLRWIAVIAVAFQIGNGVARIAAADRPHGIHYAAPYPALDNPDRKRLFLWDLSGIEPYVSRKTNVLIDTGDPWAEAHLMVFLYARRIPFAKVRPTDTYFGAGRDLGVWEPPWSPDVIISVEARAFVLRFGDGRPTVRVESGRNME